MRAYISIKTVLKQYEVIKMKDVIPFSCPICKNSLSWRQESSASGGYSYGKGIVGMAILGPVGAVAGIGGVKEVTYKCSSCGYSRTYKQ